jgi:hypothetical protein
LGSKGSKLDIYWNLHLGCWSVKDKGRVILHPLKILAEDCQLVVQPGGRRRVLETKRKNVHAFVRCKSLIIHDKLDFLVPNTWVELHYNPYKSSTFVDNSGTPFYNAKKVYMDNKKCYALI